MKFNTCDTKNIRILGSAREFVSIEDLIASGRSGKREIELTGVTYRFWWKDLTVAFPDRQHSSSSVVEVAGKQINVGNPSNYVSFVANTYVSALEIAGKVNAEWLCFAGSENDFVQQLNWNTFA